MATPALVAANTALYLKGQWDNFTNYNPVFKILKDKGKIFTGQEGTSVEWVVEAGRYAPIDVQDFEDLSGSIKRHNRHIRANLSWGEKLVHDAVGKGEFAKQGAKTALVNLQEKRVPRLAEDLLDEGLAYDFLNTDGAGGAIWGGMPSIFGAGSAVGTGTQEGTASDSYAGHSTALNGITGVDGAVADAWTPTLVNSGYGWTSGQAITEQVQYAIIQLTYGNKPSQRPTLVVHDRTRFLTLKQELLSKEQIWVSGNAGDPYGLGSNVEKAYVDGFLQIWDENMPSSVSYVLNLDQIEAHFLRIPPALSGDSAPGPKSAPGAKDMFDIECAFLPERRGLFISMTCRGQYLINPRYQGKIANYAS